MGFQCYTASGGKITTGIDGAWFPCQSQPRVMPSADIEVDTVAELDAERVEALRAASDPSLFAMGEARLVAPKDKRPERDRCLVALDLKEYWPAGDLGDESQLVILEGSGRAVFRIKAGAAYLACDGSVLVWDNGGARPRLADPASLAKATLAGALKARSKLTNIRTLRIP